MDHSLSVVVQVDLDTRYVHLVVTGDLTERNHRSLTALVDRASALVPGVTVTVDLAGARHVDPGALDLLQWSLDHGPVPGAEGSVRVLTRPVPVGFADAIRPAAAVSWTGTGRGGVAA